LVTFRQIVLREGQKEYRASLTAQVAPLDEVIGKLDREVADAREQMEAACGRNAQTKLTGVDGGERPWPL
jgi:hypothetical protein